MRKEMRTLREYKVTEEREGMASEERQGHVTLPVSHQPVNLIFKKLYIKRQEKKKKQRQQENRENAAL